MSRIRLAGAAFLFLTVLPGCGLFSGDRPNVCQRWRDCWNGGGNRAEFTPVSYPVADAGCGMTTIPNGHPYGGSPIYMGGPGAGMPLGSETLPQPGFGGTTMPPRIPAPKIGIDEGKGKQFELEGASRAGGIMGPALPVNGTR